MNKFINIKHYKKEYVKAFYGKHGKESGLNPGVLWPRKEELEHLKQYESAFCYDLHQLIEENKRKKAQAMADRIARENEVYEKLQKLPKQLEDFFKKIEDKKHEKEKWLKERETLVEEVREILGYRAKPSDERFQKALAQKEEEEIKAKKKAARIQRENAGLEEMLSATKAKET